MPDELVDTIARAIGDPGSVTLRRRDDAHRYLESVPRWSARAVVLILAEAADRVRTVRDAALTARDVAVRREAELQARIEAVCDEHQCDETCELIDCENPAGYWVSIERVRAALGPAETVAPNV